MRAVVRQSLFAVVAVAALDVTPRQASAQSLGVLSWQLQPYCNRIFVNVVANGPTYSLDGYDDQCGAPQRVGVVGTASPNPDGSIEFGLTMVAGNGEPVHVTARISLATIGGPWQDNHGGSGTLAFGAATGGSPRPLPVVSPVTVTSMNVAVGTNALSSVTTASGSTALGRDALAALTTGGENTAVGRGAAKAVESGYGNVALGMLSLGANVGGDFNVAVGAHASAAMKGDDSTAVGAEAMRFNMAVANTAVGRAALRTNVVGIENTAVGHIALVDATSSYNTAVGSQAGRATTTGQANTVVGAQTFVSNLTGRNNAAFGDSSLRAATAGNDNTAIGHHSGIALTSGSANLLLGSTAGRDLVTGSNNIYLAHVGVASESNTTRIGTVGFTTRAFVAGINGATASGGVPVYVTSQGQLGTVTSSLRFKDDIASLDDGVMARLQRLRPVSFLYKPGVDDGSKVRQYGLVAEEVAEVFPELVVRNDDGTVQTVRYHFLTPMLLAEVQRLERERRVATDRAQTLEARVATLERALESLAAVRR